MTDVAQADTEQEEAEAGAGSGGGRKKLFLLIGIAALVILLAGGGAAYFFLLSGKSPQEEMLAEAAGSAYIYDMPAMTVNLSGTDENESPHFLKLSVSLELENEAMVQVVEPRMARVRDAFQVYLRELRRGDLEGSAGIYRLKEELRRRVNIAIDPARVEDILFREILVQ